MDLTLSEPYQVLQNELRDFIRQHGDKSPKVGGGRKRPDQKTLDWQKRLVEHGYAGRTIPVEDRGFGAKPDVMAASVIATEFARANVYAGLTNQGISMLVPTLLELGTEVQKREYVGPTIRGDIIWCQGYSEPGNGSDLANAQTKAELRDGNWIVNGQKIWTSSAHYADMMFLLCRTEPDKSKHDGLSYLLLLMNSPGLESRPLKTMTGRSEFNEVFFSDVKVPEGQIGPGRGKGWFVANVTLKHERLMIGDAGKLVGRLEQLVTLLHTSDIDGVKLIEIAEYRDRLLRLQGEVLAWKAHNLRLLTDATQGVDFRGELNDRQIRWDHAGPPAFGVGRRCAGCDGLPYQSLGEDAEGRPRHHLEHRLHG